MEREKTSRLENKLGLATDETAALRLERDKAVATKERNAESWRPRLLSLEKDGSAS